MIQSWSRSWLRVKRAAVSLVSSPSITLARPLLASGGDDTCGGELEGVKIAEGRALEGWAEGRAKGGEGKGIQGNGEDGKGG